VDQARTKARKVIPVKIGHLWVILDADVVQEIVGARAWVPVPQSSPLVPGVLAWRGRAVAVFDLSVLAHAGAPLRPGVERPRTLIVQSKGCVLAMPVDIVREVQEVDASLLRAAHVTSMQHSSLEADVFGAPAPVLDLGSVVSALLEASVGGA
jgi:chemotaxis signal transduction protein